AVVRRLAARARGAHGAGEAARSDALPGDAGRVGRALRRGDRLQRHARDDRSAARGGDEGERAAAHVGDRRRPVDSGSADRGSDTARVRRSARWGTGMSSTARLWARRYAAFIRAGWMVDVQYRADIALWLLWGVTEP